MGVLPGSLFAALVIAIPYHSAWLQAAKNQSLTAVEQVDPLESVIIEISYTTVFAAYILGFLTLFFAKVRLSNWKVAFSSAPSAANVLTGSVFGGVLCGLAVAPIATLYFGRMDRPEVTPVYLLPGEILGSAILVFSMVNELERLTVSRVITRILSVIVALMIGAGAATIIFGALFYFGTTEAVMNLIQYYGEESWVLATGGAIYGIPVGVVLGIVIGEALLLTNKWAGRPVSDAVEL